VTAAAASNGAVSRKGLLQLGLSVLLLSSAWPAAKYAVQHGTSPLWFAEGRAVLSLITVTLVVLLRYRLRWPVRQDLPALLSVGGLSLAAFFAFAHLAVGWIEAGRTAILANTTTIFVVPMSLLILHEQIPLGRWLAAGLGLAGVVVLTGPWSIDWQDHNVLIGHGFLLLSALSFSIALVTVRGWRPRTSMIELLPWCFALASCLLLVLLLWRDPHGGFGNDPRAWAAIAYIGLVAGPIGTWCIMEVSANLPSVVASVGFLTTPAVGLILSNLVLGEPLTPDLLLGSALILGGVGFAARPERVSR
jgi:O-acetylserine/cysteine efflux transporter